MFAATPQSPNVLRFVSGLLVLIFVSGCVSYEYHEASLRQVSQLPDTHQAATDDALLLDVGIVMLDPGLDRVENTSVEYASVRRSEAVWFSSMLRTTMESSRGWGLVRVLPSDASPMDLTISGTLVDSTGETVALEIKAVDALGSVWLDRKYQFRTSQYSYNPEINIQQDPFQPLFTEIANNLLAELVRRDAADLTQIRQVSRLAFADTFLPELVSEYLVEGEAGPVLARAPANNDPFMQRIDAIYDRNQLFLDVVQDYYRAFNAEMDVPYMEWRKLSYKEALYERQLRLQAKQERRAGIALMAAGVVASSGRGTSTNIARYLALISGGELFANSYLKDEVASAHAETLRELGVSLENELAPSVVDLQDRTVTLSGTVDAQFEEWRGILQSLFEAEFGEPELGELESSSTETLDPQLGS